MNIIVTGASRGIGFDTALRFCKQGHYVLAVARTGSGLEKLQQAARNSGVDKNLMILSSDLTSEKDIQELFFVAKSLSPRVDILINNAGSILNKEFEKISSEELRFVYDVNFFAPFRLIQVLLPIMGGEKKSHIVNISSMGAVQGSVKFAGLSAYSSSKAALSNLTELLAVELKEKNIAVNCIALGSVQTEMLAEAFPGYMAPVSSNAMSEWIVWFALEGHKFFNGKILPVALTTP